MLKLHHLVDDKITRVRSVLQPRHPAAAGRQGSSAVSASANGGLALEATAPVHLQNAHVKSDDVAGRTKVYEAIVRGDDTFESGIPRASTCSSRMRSLGLNVELASTKKLLRRSSARRRPSDINAMRFA